MFFMSNFQRLSEKKGYFLVDLIRHLGVDFTFFYVHLGR